MRKTLLLLSTLLCAMFATNVKAQNLLENGDFEAWTNDLPDNWKSASTVSNATLSQSTDAHGGSYSVCVAGTSSNKRLAYKEMDLSAGHYTFTAYVKAATDEGGKIALGYAPIKEDGKPGTYKYQDGYFDNLTTTEWTLATFEFDLAEATKICLVVMNHKSVGKDVLVDDARLITSTPPVVELEEAANLADVKTKTAGAEYLINLSNAVVTYVNGPNAYIQDGTAGMLVYKSGHGLVAGQSISGKVKAELTLYNGLYELTSFDTAEATVTDGAEIPTTTVTVAELLANPAKYESMRVKVENVTAESAFTSRKANVVSGESTLGLYQREPDAQFTFAAGDALDVTGYPGMFKEDVQLNVWEVSDVTVLGNEPPTPPVVEPEEAANLADVKTKTAGAEYLINLSNAVVTYVNGSNAYIQDGTAGMLVYKNGHGLVAGQSISGKVKAELTLFNGLYELTSFDTAEATITDGAEIPTTTVTVAELLANPAKYESMRVKVENVTAESAFTSRKANVVSGENTLGLYQREPDAQFTFAAGDALDVTGYPGMFKEDVQLNVWEVEDVTVLGNEPPTPPVVEPEEAGSLKDAKNLPEGKYIITLENAVVTYVNGKNAYIEDGETGILVFLEEQTLEVGQVISGKVVADLANYYGLYELESFDTTNATITETEEIPLTTITVEELLADPAKYESRRVKVVNVTAESAFTNRKANIKEGEKTLGMYQKDEKAQFTFAAGDVLDVIGYPGMFREVLQFNVWEVSDVTIHTVDGISTVTTGNAPAKAYTLDGRRVEKLTKGIYIVNGKKVLVK